MKMLLFFFFFFYNDTATTEIYTLSLHDALPIRQGRARGRTGVSQVGHRGSRTVTAARERRPVPTRGSCRHAARRASGHAARRESGSGTDPARVERRRG